MSQPNSPHSRVETFFRTARDVLLPVVERPIDQFSLVGTGEFFAPENFPWTKQLEANWLSIRHELEAVMSEQEIPGFQEVLPSQQSLTQGKQWQTFLLFGYGHKVEANCSACPETTRLIESIPGMKTAFFSILAPGKHIPAHRGFYKGVLRYHLGLIVPEPKENCRIRVGKTIRHWSEGESMIFDDTYDHEVWNDTDATRVVLFMDVVRPLPSPLSMLNEGVIKFISWLPEIQKAQRDQNAASVKARHLEMPADEIQASHWPLSEDQYLPHYPLTLSFERFSFGRKVHILGADAQPLLYVRQRAWALKEVVDIFAVTAAGPKLYQIKADRVLDYSATYTIATAEGIVMGTVSRQGMRSRWRALFETLQSFRHYGWSSDRIRPIWNVAYLIRNTLDEEVGQIVEEMPLMKLVGTIFSELLWLRPFLNPAYKVNWHGQQVFESKKLPAVFSRTFSLAQRGGLPDSEEPLLLTSLVMALLIEKNLGI